MAAPLVTAAVLATAMVGLAELTDATTLDESFEAGGERVIDVQMTLIAYLCATAVVIGATAVPTGRRALRRIPPVAAAVGALAPIPLVNGRATEYIGGLATDAVLAGVIVGGIAAFLLGPLGVRALIGVASHLVLLWVATLAFIGWTETVVYAGLVQPIGTTVLDDLLGDALGYHLPTLLPYALVAVAVTAALGYWFARRGASRGTAVLAATAAPILAAVLYPVVGMDLWNGKTAPVAAGVAVIGALAALAATARTKPAVPAARRS
ncbi:hypothetical protein Vau01_004250 [Virgisporangium aurantiacum]|uniref:Uncharacterized protein n=1 Tax=Virgisporangium aurantiacum TaxID=175570 RepID=A0A8J3YVX8_9ACTN|nr:hypothetical protein Vau01_004250 [Virgisporangium aurantiacum]